MIYLFNCCKDGCKLPGQVCERLGEACKGSPCAHICQECGSFFNELINRPMGGFVFMAVWVGAVELGCCGWALLHSDWLKDCKFPTPQ
eukprot:CAMPEP_0197942442 /NCGR_PEP_ID=MMETSP1439-20131203/124382_1 /TAXON_ID=66791 /ORGANISM="Gonyaulax spinifera, Strain CCMP409" /LENGTH=87 /DNA_ID=CAMNT_0043565699 /DNA_START=93 /DNA_END=353 /DNA_ORIENTATION=+